MRLVVETIEFASREMPLWNSISISGYHIREAGSTAIQELAFNLADGLEYARWCVDRGMDIDSFAPRLSFFFNCHNDASKFGMTPETLRIWVRRAEVDGGARPGLTTEERERLRELERENRELRRANEILKAASAFFARELDPRLPKCPASSTPTACASGSSRSAASCRSPRRRTARRGGAGPPHAGCETRR